MIFFLTLTIFSGIIIIFQRTNLIMLFENIVQSTWISFNGESFALSILFFVSASFTFLYRVNIFDRIRSFFLYSIFLFEKKMLTYYYYFHFAWTLDLVTLMASPLLTNHSHMLKKKDEKSSANYLIQYIINNFISKDSFLCS